MPGGPVLGSRACIPRAGLHHAPKVPRSREGGGQAAPTVEAVAGSGRCYPPVDSGYRRVGRRGTGVGNVGRANRAPDLNGRGSLLRGVTSLVTAYSLRRGEIGYKSRAEAASGSRPGGTGVRSGSRKRGTGAGRAGREFEHMQFGDTRGHTHTPYRAACAVCPCAVVSEGTRGTYMDTCVPCVPEQCGTVNPSNWGGVSFGAVARPTPGDPS
jgi:hypothetical protein